MTERKKKGSTASQPEQNLGLGADSAASQHLQHQHPQHLGFRAGVAAVARSFIYRLRLRLRLLWRLVRRRITPVSDLPDQATEEPRTPGSEHLHPRRGRQESHHAFKPDRLRRVSRPSVKIEEEEPSTPLVVVNGLCVSKELEARYNEYSRLSALVPVNSLVCHMCFFEMQRHENCTVLESKILWHCSEKHTMGTECTVAGCRVRLPTPRDLDLHMHFCHTNLP